MIFSQIILIIPMRGSREESGQEPPDEFFSPIPDRSRNKPCLGTTGGLLGKAEFQHHSLYQRFLAFSKPAYPDNPLLIIIDQPVGAGF
ncbi:hypothetical protein JIN84_12545 [Luteolibacter yonseiensis]|uniref:Uncharacterized protein n=1 Tax=Luteolibacter yonseiensis TaxID=1144680 RepID=A0A934R5P5_9BACT|nr:hypothetical protein [Luteolibacter yonseiensis]MBK1816448.1 hypothetical protein [Luteolibacter yonseiensis]